MPKVGVLALQGDFLEHLEILREIPGLDVRYVKKPEDLKGLDAIIIPGGESTAIGSLMKVKGLDRALVDFVSSGGAIMGTCAGAILLAKRVRDRVVGEINQRTLGLMSIAVLRNAFGRQKDSFIAHVDIEGVGRVKGVFIRAPAIIEAWGRAKITASIDHPAIGKVGVAAVEDRMLALAFHPEISKSISIYEYFLSIVKR